MALRQTGASVVVLAAADPAAWLTIGGPGVCGAVPAPAPLPVAFGEAMAAGCAWPLSAADVADCRALRARAAALLLAAAPQPALLGRFGNSDQTQPALDWVAVQGRGAPPVLSLDPGPATNVCPDVPTGLHLEILTAMCGPGRAGGPATDATNR